MLAKLSKAIDTFNIKQGDVSSLLALPLLVVVVYEVVMRYAFNAPTTWGFEATTFLYGVHYMLGLAYCDVYGGHVRVDIFHLAHEQKAAGCHRHFDQSGLFHAGDGPDDYRILEIRPDIHRRPGAQPHQLGAADLSHQDPDGHLLFISADSGVFQSDS
jgi:hypothetical protein